MSVHTAIETSADTADVVRARATQREHYPAAVQTERPLSGCVCLNGHKSSRQAQRGEMPFGKSGERHGEGSAEAGLW